MRSIIGSICVSMVAMLLITCANAQNYKSGDTGSFGMKEKWNYNVPVFLMNSTNDVSAIGFTAFEDITVDRILLRLIGIDAGTTFRIGLMGDDGMGNPDNNWLISAVVDPPDGSPIVYHTFGSYDLVAGTTYYVVVTPVNYTGSFYIYASAGRSGVQLYSRRIDSKMRTLYRDEGGAWILKDQDPYFTLGNGSDVAVSGPSQPYQGQNGSLVAMQGGTGRSIGQRFTIFDGEIAVGSMVQMSNITFTCSREIEVTNSMLVELRDNTLTSIMASGIVANADISIGTGGTAQQTEHTVSWNSPVWLDQGVPYVVTFSFIGPRPTSFDYIHLQDNLAANVSMGDATWGGTYDCAVIQSGGSGDWSSFIAGPVNADIRISFTGLVYTPPKGTVITVN